MPPAGKETIHILLILDCREDCCLMEGMLQDSAGIHFEIETVHSLTEGTARLAEKAFHVVILDLGLPESSGIESLKKILGHTLEVPIVVLTGHDDDELGVAAIKEGAQDYLSKAQLDRNTLLRSIRYSIERHRLLAELHRQSLEDYLTGLNNRRGFFLLAQQHAKLAKRMKRALLIMIADLDGMKKINDTFGHEAGDRALVEIATVLKNTFRDADITARIGGDEFAVCIIDDDTSTADVVIARLNDNIRSANTRAKLPYRLSLSVGVARFGPDAETTFDEMLAQADALMYEEKRSKRHA